MAVGDMIRTPALGKKSPGDTAYGITQEYGVYNAEADALGWYDYAAAHGLKKGEHPGLDIAAPRGTRAFALNPGTVEFAGFSDSFSPHPVVIKTQDNPSTPGNEAGHIEIYGHLMQDTVRQGDIVKPGTHLGFTGEQTVAGTENPDGSGPHLHFELGRLPNVNTPVVNAPGPSGRPDAARGTPYTLVNPTNWLKQGGDPSSTPGPGGDESSDPGSDPGGPVGTGLDPTAILASVGEILKQFWWIILGALLIGIGVWKVA